MLALEAAASFASLGNRVLLCCWNVVLAAWLRQSLRAELQVLGISTKTTRQQHAT